MKDYNFKKNRDPNTEKKDGMRRLPDDFNLNVGSPMVGAIGKGEKEVRKASAAAAAKAFG
jgi:hypothetical protein